MINAAITFLSQLWATIVAELRLRPEVIARATATPLADAVAATIAVLAGSSMLLGQSVTLFLNRVTPRRFVYSLVFFGLVFALSQAAWALIIWAVATTLYGASQSPITALLVVARGSAPLLFGFLVALPYFGMPVEWALRTWSMLAVVVAMQAPFQLSFEQALLSALLGWLLAAVLTRVFGRQLNTLRDAIWQVVTGTIFDTSEEELIAATNNLRAQLGTADSNPLPASARPATES